MVKRVSHWSEPAFFWGAGVTLRFLLVLWVPVALGITDNATPTYLNAMVAIGIVVGAGAAAKLVTLETVSRCMPAGILIGVVVLIFLFNIRCFRPARCCCFIGVWWVLCGAAECVTAGAG